MRFFPVDDILPELKAAILANHVVILQVPAKPPVGSACKDFFSYERGSLF
ncbi:MAG: hypothetical protein ACXU98_05220 [Syntrophales bacterium]